jgi:rfaE bifunctional protein nucleotidyltransferase chain/domain
MKRYESARSKITSRPALVRAARQAQARRRSVVFTNGCFDLLHAGHVTLLERARRHGDLLVVGLNSDRSVRAIKGPNRPLVAQRDRALVVAALACVDYVTIFDEDTPHRLIERLQPDVLIKGADWPSAEIVGREVVKRRGGRIVRVRLLRGYSTSRLVERIRQGR